MNWKQITIGKKIAIGSGVILILLAVIGFLSYSGVDNIVRNAREVIRGNELDGILAQKEVDHLNWANKVNDLLTNDTVTKLEVQTDDHKCGFGEWLYGEGRIQAETLVPSLASLLKEIEEPHRKLHESAVEISHVFEQPHTGLALTLSERLTDHVSWVGRLGKALASEAGGLYSYQALLKNAVDQAMSVIQTDDNENQADLKTRQHDALRIIEKLRYGSQDEGYFFVIDENARMVMHPFKPELAGKDVSSNKDPKGKQLFSEMVRISKEKGEGFVTYSWPLPGTEQLAPKISYVKLYKPWGWILGSGVYLDHTNGALLARADDFAVGKPFSAGVEIDSTKCAFGRFLADPKTTELGEAFPELEAALGAIRKPHERLHDTAARIVDKVNLLEMHAAIQIFNEKTQKYLDELKVQFNSAVEAEQKLQEGLEKANRVYAETTMPNLSAVQSLLGDIRKEAKKHIISDNVILTEAQGTKRNVTLVGIAAFVIGILLAFFTARGIVVILTKISSRMDEGADQVAFASEQVSTASQELAEASSEQAASIEETSSSLEEMSAMTKQNAGNAIKADDLMKEVNQVVAGANSSMLELTQSMEEISKASEETFKIIKTIDEIAFQTNLLALNAAVEAARAGEAGAGFAVVADEVRNLAMRAADAAKSTAGLIEGTVKKIKDGGDLAGTTNEAFAQVGESAAKVGELIGEISAASNEQAQGIEQVNKAVADMDKVVQHNAANAEESASASEEMHAQAEDMKSTVRELVSIVRGSKHLSDGRRRSGGAKKAKTTHNVSHLLDASVEGEKTYPSISNRTEIIPDHVFPMNEADMRDF